MAQRHGARRHGRHRHRHPYFYYYPYAAYYYPYYYPYNYGYYEEPVWTQPEGCPEPLLDGCTVLNMTARWATACFMPRYRYLRQTFGNDHEAIASAIAREESPGCAFPAQSGAAAEYERRIQLAVAVLLNADGVPVRYPPAPSTPRPSNADSIMQPWMRALLTGWV